jgi:hypothetical protein
MYPSASDRNRSIINPGDPQLLETFDSANDVDQSVYRSHFVESDSIGRQAVDPSLGLSQQLEGVHCPLFYPDRKIGPLDYRDQLPNMPVAA